MVIVMNGYTIVYNGCLQWIVIVSYWNVQSYGAYHVYNWSYPKRFPDMLGNTTDVGEISQMLGHTIHACLPIMIIIMYCVLFIVFCNDLWVCMNIHFYCHHYVISMTISMSYLWLSLWLSCHYVIISTIIATYRYNWILLIIVATNYEYEL